LISEIKYTRTSHVWLSEDLKNSGSDNFVAVKVLESIDTTQDGMKELFRRECESLARLSHQNIITYIDAGVNTEDDSFYVVTEYFKSQNLNDFKKSKKNLTEDNIFKILSHILQGLAHAHQKNVIHRDLKPSNILVDEQFNVKIIDFGISKIIGYSYITEDTVCDYMTIAYASPEQLLRNELRPSSDLFSLGAIVYFLIKGEHPPENKELLLPEINKLVCCDELKRLMRGLLQINPSQRPGIHQVIRDVNSLIEKDGNRATYKLVLFNNIPKELYSLGLASYYSYDHARSSVEDDLKISKIYKRKNTYYLIGKKGKYHCRLSTGKNGLDIFRVNNIDDYTEWEKETKKAIDIKADLCVIKEHLQIPEDASLQEFLGTVEVEEKNGKYVLFEKNYAIRF